VNYDPAEILAAQEHFGFARPTAIEKDWLILRAMGAIASIDAAPLQIRFRGRHFSSARSQNSPAHVLRLGDQARFRLFIAGVFRLCDAKIVNFTEVAP
jgi:hypothetical protein